MFYKIFNAFSSVLYLTVNILYMLLHVPETTFDEYVPSMLICAGLGTFAMAMCIYIRNKPGKVLSIVSKILVMALDVLSLFMIVDYFAHIPGFLFDELVYTPRVFVVVTAFAVLAVVLLEVFTTGKKPAQSVAVSAPAMNSYQPTPQAPAPMANPYQPTPQAPTPMANPYQPTLQAPAPMANPYQPTPQASAPMANSYQPTPAYQAPVNGWTCPGCGNVNTDGIFCGNCGMRRMAPVAQNENSAWTCPKCGHTLNTGKFCGVCGFKKNTTV